MPIEGLGPRSLSREFSQVAIQRLHVAEAPKTIQPPVEHGESKSSSVGVTSTMSESDDRPEVAESTLAEMLSFAAVDEESWPGPGYGGGH